MEEKTREKKSRIVNCGGVEVAEFLIAKNLPRRNIPFCSAVAGLEGHMTNACSMSYCIDRDGN